ncbi:short-chain dehydrogenase [Durotheca rogersii]|uniref:short-chain dehydrogenase n=1 Tax=Durotheca rogersii TaxID=419775 RepID=UPI00221F442B|nr:short-chain dehydrogenase [Durotheca rogersii]KAI5863224.1 short-chain dehydrogenase [Durotheca rogersii]
MDVISDSLWGKLAIAGLVLLLSVSAFALTMGVFPSKNHMPVEGKTVLITGASEGLGRSVARQMAAKGANVILVSRSAAKLESALAEVRAAARDPQAQRFHYLTADVSRPDYAVPLLAEAVAWNGGRAPDVVWCVAGVSTPALWIETPLAATRSQMDVNFWGSAELAHAALRLWCGPGAAAADEPPRHLVFTSSVVAFFPVVGYGPYTPAKGALRALADTLVQEVELYPQKVRVHVVYPGSISSPGFEIENRTKPEITKIIEDGDPVQTPDDVAALAIAGLERGYYSVTVAFLGHAMRWSALGGAPRNSWLVDTIMSCLVPLAWIFILPDIFAKIRNYAKKHGHPATYQNKN